MMKPREVLGSRSASTCDLFLCSWAASPGSFGAAPAKRSSGGGSWHKTHFKGILLFAVQKLRRVLVTLNMRYFSVYAVNLFFVCVYI